MIIRKLLNQSLQFDKYLKRPGRFWRGVVQEKFSVTYTTFREIQQDHLFLYEPLYIKPVMPFSDNSFPGMVFQYNKYNFVYLCFHRMKDGVPVAGTIELHYKGILKYHTVFKIHPKMEYPKRFIPMIEELMLSGYIKSIEEERLNRSTNSFFYWNNV